MAIGVCDDVEQVREEYWQRVVEHGVTTSRGSVLVADSANLTESIVNCGVMNAVSPFHLELTSTSTHVEAC